MTAGTDDVQDSMQPLSEVGACHPAGEADHEYYVLDIWPPQMVQPGAVQLEPFREALERRGAECVGTQKNLGEKGARDTWNWRSSPTDFLGNARGIARHSAPF